jgi:transcriptional regulator with XRE-family HTH domain
MKIKDAHKINKLVLGQKFKQLRESRNLTQEEVASYFNWKKQVISDLETGKAFSLEKFLLLGDFFGVSFEDLKEVAVTV